MMVAANPTSVNELSVTRRYNLQFKFWLNANDDFELWLADEIAKLKSKRSFTRTIRDGIRLVIDLRAGKTDVLFELFPWVRNMVIAAAAPTPPMIRPIAAAPRDFQSHELDLKITVVKDADAGKRATQNFINSCTALVYGEKPKPKEAGIKKIATAGQPLTTPAFDDLELGEL